MEAPADKIQLMYCLQDDIECLRHTSEKEQWALASKLAQSEEQVRHLEKRVAVLTKRSEAECVALGFQPTLDERLQGRATSESNNSRG